MALARRRWLVVLLTGIFLITLGDAQQMGPIISPNITEIILQKGQNFTMFCKGNGQLRFAQQFIHEEQTGDFQIVLENVTSGDPLYTHEVALHLYNVDQFSIGYYACFDAQVNESSLLKNIVEEPDNTEHVSYIYIYVNGTDVLYAPMKEVVIVTNELKYLIQCRPTTPDIEVRLRMDDGDSAMYESYSPKVGFMVNVSELDVPTLMFMTIMSCEFVGPEGSVSKDVFIHKYSSSPAQEPTIIDPQLFFLQGETLKLNCTIEPQKGMPVSLSWSFPPTSNKVSYQDNQKNYNTNVLYNQITIENANEENSGNYTCTSTNTNNKSSVDVPVRFLKKGFVEVRQKDNKSVIEPLFREKSNIKGKFRTKFTINAYPPAIVTVLKDNKKIFNSSKCNITITPTEVSIMYHGLDVSDTGRYTVIAANPYATDNDSFFLGVKSKPNIWFTSRQNERHLEGTRVTLACKAIGYPVPQITWSFNGIEFPGETVNQTLYEVESYAIVTAMHSGNVTCKATNLINIKKYESHASRRFLVYELADGFGIINKQTRFYEGQDVILTCLASKYDYQNVTWEGDDFYESVTSENEFSYVAQLKIPAILLAQDGNYMCVAYTNDGAEETRNVDVIVEKQRPPRILIPVSDTYMYVHPFRPQNLTCVADAVPRAKILWYKDGTELKNETGTDIWETVIDYSVLNSTLIISADNNTLYDGKYECHAMYESLAVDDRDNKFFVLTSTGSAFNTTYIYIIGAVILVLLFLVIYLALKIRKEKRFRKQLAAAGLLYFVEGVPQSINPNLPIDEQAELLPYDPKFEFDVKKLKLGLQLGAGAFGVVYKAQAHGIINAEEVTDVAVKTVKKTADNMYIKALATELKIMIHLGKHLNVVNLLGACTTSISKRELLVIVEYCRYGNLHSYMQKHRQVFIDQLTDTKNNLGNVNRGFSSTSGNSGMHSDYFGSNHSQTTDNTFLNSANTNRSERKDKLSPQVMPRVSESGYLQKDCSIYNAEIETYQPRPLYSRDLLAWAYQISRGMEYLASRKVLHGDLAARNVLLAEDGIVKICDFGLARSMYKKEEYHKKEDSPLPVKWLAIECITDRIFSTQSDVWAYGILLWELFSLAKTPYPDISAPMLLHRLSDGYRLEKPQYADDHVYDVMRRCWNARPTERPSFTELQKIMGGFLNDNERQRYLDLNEMLVKGNPGEDHEDYLAMMQAPDYNNMVTPSPHEYENEMKYLPPTPSQAQPDEEGYLPMSPASRPNTQRVSNKFNFDPRYLSTVQNRNSEEGSESTPMLTLNHLHPRTGSESDHEITINLDSPKIEDSKENAKNITNTATNLTYIALDNGSDKHKSNSNSNAYVNVPNVLVK